MFPQSKCLSPRQVLDVLQQVNGQSIFMNKIMLDERLLSSEKYQRPYQYLLRYDQKSDFDNFKYKESASDNLDCLKLLLKYCSMSDPSWSALSHFAQFFNTQLQDFEKFFSLNVNLDKELAGFKRFVITVTKIMSQDFATPSLQLHESDVNAKDTERIELESYQLRRRWEKTFHPCLSFNNRGDSLSFIQVKINEKGDLCNPLTNEIVEPQIVSEKLLKTIAKKHGDKIKFFQDFNGFKRSKQLEILCEVCGLRSRFDPDLTYELTMDNILKILAIHMRFRCGIPVIVMGETGCGKTRMIEFISKLKKGSETQTAKNMVVIKIHGGITVSILQNEVKNAIELAQNNQQLGLETLLFLDEANTTEAIYAIKEIVCDATVHGKEFAETGLKIVAACNPYRKQDDLTIDNMEKTGLGYNVQNDDVVDRFATTPMRHLVYRVIPLPPSMQPLVWDFGSLDEDTEEIYIKQMVFKLQRDVENDKRFGRICDNDAETITKCLSASQKYMRENRTLCPFVSLRDVERTVMTFKWFYENLEKFTDDINIERSRERSWNQEFSLLNQALIHALGVCYHATLVEREGYRKVLASLIPQREHNENHPRTQSVVTQEDILNEIIICQKLFINAIQLEKNIGRNEALRENVFMMIICFELRIPLFLVGKPGSSKSLAKTIVADAMQGKNSKSDLLKKLKEAHVLSFQCSATTDAIGIEKVFGRCAKLQKNKPMDKFVAVVVLDEIGLAEDSPRMPLKVLHPLLENATTNIHLAGEPHSKVGFVGISNWALDPAKMNRGVFVARDTPTHQDLRKTAEAIFESDGKKFAQVSVGVINALTSAYLEISENQKKEFFGLRDYYGLLKMLFAFAKENEGVIEYHDLARLILRNFSGSGTNALRVFRKCLEGHCASVYDVSIPVQELVQENLNSNFESRFLLLLTNRYSAVGLLSNVLGSIEDPQVIFGSSFPRDSDYTEVCRNINKIKVCMETGRAVVLLNLQDLYESLYDALNQHYVTFAGQQYVDIGLGGVRVKCKIAKNFRLVVIEEKEVVHKMFPIPLTNRLEKHVFDMTSLLTDPQRQLMNRLVEWVKNFITTKANVHCSFSREDTFPGYTDDTPASSLLLANCASASSEEILRVSKKIMLQTATFDGVCRLSKSKLQSDATRLQSIYLKEQVHENLFCLLQQELGKPSQFRIIEVTSFSQVLSDNSRKLFQAKLCLDPNCIMLLNLRLFQTEQSFVEKLDQFFKPHSDIPNCARILLIQCPQAQSSGRLIACAKYATTDKVSTFQRETTSHAKFLIVFILALERQANAIRNQSSLTSFHSKNCESFYVDELKCPSSNLESINLLWKKSIPEIFQHAMKYFDHSGSLLNIECLFQECIPEAMAKLKNDGALTMRPRVPILKKCCFAKNFLKIMLKHILELLKEWQHKNEDVQSCLEEVSFLPQTLQEGGSLRNAVWMYLRKLTAVAIAQVISIVDADANLDLFTDSSPQVADLWLQVFDCKSLLKMHWSDLTTTFPVKTQFCCKFPFFRIFGEHLSMQLLIINDRKKFGQNVDNKRQQLINKIQNTEILNFLNIASEAKMANLLLKAFTHDLVLHLHKTPLANQVEIEIIQNCLLELYQAHKNDLNFNKFVEIFILYEDHRLLLEQFSSIVAIKPEILENHEAWMEEQKEKSELVVHRLALASLLKKLCDQIYDSKSFVTACKKWMIFVDQVKPLANLLIPDSNDKVKQMWTKIEVVEMFLTELLPASSNQEANYLNTIAFHARRLSKGIGLRVANIDLSSQKFMNIVTKSLEACVNETKIKMLCAWNDTKCKSCRADPIKTPIMLPCKHYVCLECKPAENASNASCPKCRRSIPDATKLEPVVLTADQETELKKFKRACISFFLEYLLIFCFPIERGHIKRQQSQAQKDTVDLVLNRLVIQDESIQRELSFINDFGLDVTARSHILKLLLSCNEASYVEQSLNNHFKTLTSLYGNKSDLLEVYTYCAFNMLQTQANEAGVGEGNELNTFTLKLIDYCRQNSMKNLSQIGHLNLNVKLQYIVQMLVSSVYDLSHEPCNSAEEYYLKRFVKSASDFCRHHRIVQEVFVKSFCQKHGIDSFKILLAYDDFRCFVPDYLILDLNADEENFYLKEDMLVLTGSTYATIKESLQGVTQRQDAASVLEVLHHQIDLPQNHVVEVFLSLCTWVAKDSNLPTDLRRETYEEVMEDLQNHISGKPYQQILTDIANSKFDCFKMHNLSSRMQHKINELLAVFSLTIHCRDEGLLGCFAGLIKNPERYYTAFLPTMPTSNYFMIKDVMAEDKPQNFLLRWWYGSAKLHICPNGHPYYIGECTKAKESGICPECRQPIGAKKNDVLHDGNQVIEEVTEESQAGYKLDLATLPASIAPERQLTRLAVCAIRFFLHAALLVGSRNNKAAIQR